MLRVPEMSMRGSCSCNNILFSWKNIDFSIVPRRCGCTYCADKKAAYVSKSGTLVEVGVRQSQFHSVKHHGSGLAEFHECTNCGDLVFVSVLIKAETYCALNVNCLEKRDRFPEAVDVNFSDQPPEVKLERWKLNWCHPVLVTHQGTKGASSRDALPARPA